MIFELFEKIITPFPKEEEKIEPPPKSFFGFCNYYTKGLWRYFITVAIFSSIIAISEIYLFSFLGKLVDWLSLKDRATFLQDEKLYLIFFIIIILFILPLVIILQTLFLHQILMGNFPMRFRWLTHRIFLNQDLSFFANEFAGRLTTKVMQTALALRDSLIKFLDVVVYVAVYFFSMIILISTAEIRFLIPMIFWLVSYAIILTYFIPRFSKISEKQADARAEMNGRLSDSYTNISTIKLFSHTKRESNYIKESMQNFLNTVNPQMRLATLSYSSIWILNILLIFILSSLSIYLWLKNNIQVSSITIALALAFRMNGMSHWFLWEISVLFENIGTVRDGLETISRPISINDSADAKILKVTKGKIEFINVNFSYLSEKENKGVFKNLYLKIEAGKKIGIVGKSGSGKTTLVNLLLRFYNLQSGKILIDGQDISLVTQESLRENIGMVTQEPSLLHRSVKENIIFANPKATDLDLEKAITDAAAVDFIKNLQDYKGNIGLDAQVGERGIKLSGGQRQRIAIARVLIKNAPILILDEATSALDSEIENVIQDSLNTIMKDKTVIAIAHRLSTVVAMDELIVLDQGKIVEIGTHKELLKLNGIYTKLWKRQSGNFLGIE